MAGEDINTSFENFPNHIREALKLASKIKIEAKIDKIIITGIGGSALPGNILKDYLSGQKTPILVNKDYFLPETTNSKTLVFVISYSGNTEETINAYRNAWRKGAKIIAITSGGKLEELCSKQKVPHVSVPSGLQPRAALCYLFFSVLAILQNSKIIPDKTKDIEDTIKTLSKPIFKSMAKGLAKQLRGKIPLIYASNRFRSVAMKWKTDFNENSKIHAFYNIFPELNHNEIVGFTNPRADYHVIMIADDEDYEKIRKRMKITKKLITGKNTEVTEMRITGNCYLTKIFSAICIGSWTSYFLAKEYNTNPTNVEIIEKLKKELA